MFKIGEFSKITQVSIRMLRYYDEQGLLAPSAVDKENGYRLYSSSQIEMLNRIVLLRDMGFQVKEIKLILTNWNEESIRENLEEQRERARQAVLSEQSRLRQIEGYIKDLENQEKQLHIQIITKEIPAYQVISLRRIVENYYCEGELWSELGAALQNQCAYTKNTSFSIYHDLDYREQEVDIEVCMEVEKKEVQTNSKVQYRQVDAVPIAACFMVYGPYSNISPAYKEFAIWLDNHPEYKMSGENRQICHVSACQTKKEEEYITELQIPLEFSDSYLTLT